MKSGFSAIELVISLGISTLLLSALFMMYNQITKNMMRVDRYVAQDSQILALRQRLSQDISGLSAVWYTQSDLEKKKNAGKEKSDQKNIQENKTQAKYFYSTNKENNLQMLTFVTNNPLQTFGSSQDRFARVVYQVEQKSENDKKNLKLLRKELKQVTENIDEAALAGGKSYELATGIKSIEMSYHLIDVQELLRQQQAKEKGAPAQKEKPIMRVVKEWTAKDIQNNATVQEKQSEEKDEQDLGGAVVPKFIEMKIVFEKTHTSGEKSYTLFFTVPSSVDNIPRNISLSKESKKQPEETQNNNDAKEEKGELREGLK